MSLRKKPAYLKEAVLPFDSRTAMEEAARCLLCHDAPCSKACPAGTDPASFIMSLRFRNEKGAAETIRSANPLGGVCARVCPYDRLCEEACSRCGIDRPIEIGRLQGYAADQESVYGMTVMEPAARIGRSAACIGAGPASLSCAAFLAQNGVDVTIYEQKEKAGGLLTYGILPARLSQETVDRELAHFETLGIRFVFGKEVGKDVSLSDLRREYDAVFIGTGLGAAKALDIPGADLKGVVSALDFLEEARRTDGHPAVGKNVVVIGGGDVAMDAASTAALLGARTTIVYRRTLEEAPANTREIEFTQSLGVGFALQFRPESIEGRDGAAALLHAVGTDGESRLTLKADQVILAIGQENACDLGEGIAVDEKKLIRTENGKTSVEGIFAGGDVTNGGKTVVQAVADGKMAAFSMLNYLRR